MKQHKTWHPIHRSLLDHWVWMDKPFSYGHAWVDLILLAQHSPIRKIVNQQSVDLDVGQLCWPRYKLAERWGWGRGRCDRFLDRLEADSMLSIQTNSKVTVITLTNYKELHEAAKEGQALKQTAKGAAKQSPKDAAIGAAIQKGEKEDLSPAEKSAAFEGEKKEEGIEVAPLFGSPGKPPAGTGRKPRPEEPIWDTVCDIFGLTPVTKREQTRIGGVVRDLKQKGATPDAIRTAYARAQQKGWEDLSPEGLVTRFDQLSQFKPPAPASTVYIPRY